MLKESDSINSVSHVEGIFKPVRIHDISPNHVLGFDIFIFLPVNGKYVKYIKANDTIGENQIQRLKARQINELYVRAEDIALYNKCLSVSFREKLKNASDDSSKQKIIQNAAAEIIMAVDTLTEDGDRISWNNYCVEMTKAVITDLTDASISSIFEQLKKFMVESPNLVNHSLSVCSLASIVAMSLGIYNSKTLAEVAFGGLLHDIGLSRSHENIVQKFLCMQELTVKEFDEFKRHPQEGIKILSKILKSKHITDNVLRIVLEHHENLSGAGFPRKISGLRISYLTKIVSIADRLSLELFNVSDKADFKYSVLKIRKEQERDKALDASMLEMILQTIT